MITHNELMETKDMIYKICYKYSKYYSVEDLFQVGVIGLMKAKRNFNSNMNTKFTTYAYNYILGEIIEFIKNDRTIKVSSDTLKLYKAYEKSKDFLTNELGRNVTLEEVSKFMNIDINLLSDTIIKSEFVLSTDTKLSDDFTLDQIAGKDTRKQIDDLIDLRDELKKLTNEERKLIELRYFKDYTQSETAEVLNMSQVQVSRNETKILKKMYSRIAS